MTSSLVGSEMCIRDRRFTRRPGRLCALASRQTLQSRCFGKCVSKCNVETVSYTHLTLPTICSV
eukprot:10628710-Prorocentrum_lima.AAC.1